MRTSNEDSPSKKAIIADGLGAESAPAPSAAHPKWAIEAADAIRRSEGESYAELKANPSRSECWAEIIQRNAEAEVAQLKRELEAARAAMFEHQNCVESEVASIQAEMVDPLLDRLETLKAALEEQAENRLHDGSLCFCHYVGPAPHADHCLKAREALSHWPEAGEGK